MRRPRPDQIVAVAVDRCVGCGYCALACPCEAIRMVQATAVIRDECTACWVCLRHCPVGALSEGRRRAR